MLQTDISFLWHIAGRDHIADLHTDFTKQIFGLLNDYSKMISFLLLLY